MSGAIVGPAGVLAGRHRIILVEDNQEFGESIARLLSLRYSVQTTSDRAGAVNLTLETLPELLLAGISIPGDDGLEIIRKLRGDERTSDMPIIVYSPPGGEELRVRAFEAGVN